MGKNGNVDFISCVEFDPCGSQGFEHIRKTLSVGCHLQRTLAPLQSNFVYNIDN